MSLFSPCVCVWVCVCVSDSYQQSHVKPAYTQQGHSCSHLQFNITMQTSEGTELCMAPAHDDAGRCIIIVFVIHSHYSSFWNSLYTATVTSAWLPHELWIILMGQIPGQKAVRPSSPLCATSLIPYKFISSQNWQWGVLHNAKTRWQS